MFLQRTLKKTVQIEGVGLHTGELSRLRFAPAPVNSGIYFVRRDLPGSPALSARWEYVKSTAYATTLTGSQFSVSTVEHCLSALAALRIDNLFIELDGPEIPIGDGSASVFLNALVNGGIVEQDEPRKYAYITKPIYFGTNEKHAYVKPYNGLRVTCTIEFPHPKIGLQKIDLDVNEYSFTHELSKARTFGFLRDVEALKARGLARGGSFENAIVLDHADVMNVEGLRYPDEFVRHKAMDALGDLVTLGMPLMGHVVLYKSGHDIMNQLVRKIVESRDCYRHIELGADLSEPASEDNYFWNRS